MIRTPSFGCRFDMLIYMTGKKEQIASVCGEGWEGSDGFVIVGLDFINASSPQRG